MEKIKINTLADFKKAINVGTKLNTIWHQYSATKGENGYLIFESHTKENDEVSIVKSTQFAVKRKKKDGTFIDSWMQFPKASECTFNDNSVTINDETMINFETREKKVLPFMTYTLID